MHFPTLLPLLLPIVTALSPPAGLTVDVVQSVSCTRKTVSGDSIEVHYRGSLASDGSEFDSSYGRGQPLKFKVGKGMVIKGWDEGLLDMCVGEKRKLTIAPELAYGDRGAGPIPGGSTLSEWAVAMILP